MTISRALKRDPTGGGFTHLGSDGVVRAFDRDLRVLDATPLDLARRSWAQTPDADVLEEVRRAVGRSRAELAGELSARQEGGAAVRQALEGKRQAESCVSENCPDDAWCQGLSLYGYNCSSCYFVEANIGNCQEF